VAGLVWLAACQAPKSLPCASDAECPSGTSCALEFAQCVSVDRSGDAPAQTGIDQELGACQSPPVTQCATAFLQSNGQSAAQFFSPSRSGCLTTVRLRMANPTPHIVRVLIVSAGHDSQALSDPAFDVASHTIASADLAMTAEMAWQDVDLTSPPAVAAAEHYIIVAQLIGPSDEGNVAHWELYNYWQGDMVDSYPRGRMYDCDEGCTSWTLEGSYRDLAFQTYLSSCP